MGHKINPLGFRIGITEAHRSIWYAKGSKYADLVLQDHKIRSFLKDRFKSAAATGAETAEQRLIGWCAQAGSTDAGDRQRSARILSKVARSASRD